MKDNRIKAMQKFICEEFERTSYEDMETAQSKYDEFEFDTGYGCYLVVDEDEREMRWKESIDNYIYDCVLSEIPEVYRRYFDRDAFVSDCRHDGYGHTLSSYDGNEHEVEVDGVTFYLYKN